MSFEETTKMKSVLKIQSEIRRVLADELRKREFIELSPVILSPITDPLNHPTSPATINCYGKNYSVTQSMIFHKQLALRTLDKFFVFSPNVRLEPEERKNTGRHLFEFTQLDFEIAHAKMETVFSVMEGLMCGVVSHVKEIGRAHV